MYMSVSEVVSAASEGVSEYVGFLRVNRRDYFSQIIPRGDEADLRAQRNQRS